MRQPISQGARENRVHHPIRYIASHRIASHLRKVSDVTACTLPEGISHVASHRRVARGQDITRCPRCLLPEGKSHFASHRRVAKGRTSQGALSQKARRSVALHRRVAKDRTSQGALSQKACRTSHRIVASQGVRHNTGYPPRKHIARRIASSRRNGAGYHKVPCPRRHVARCIASSRTFFARGKT